MLLTSVTAVWSASCRSDTKICHSLNDNDVWAKTSQLRRAIPDHCERRALEHYGDEEEASFKASVFKKFVICI